MMVEDMCKQQFSRLSNRLAFLLGGLAGLFFFGHKFVLQSAEQNWISVVPVDSSLLVTVICILCLSCIKHWLLFIRQTAKPDTIAITSAESQTEDSAHSAPMPNLSASQTDNIRCQQHNTYCGNNDLLLYKTLFEMSSDGMLITDGETRIIHVNPAFCKITGYSAREAIGKPTNLLNSGCHDGHFYRELWKSLRLKQVWQGEIWNKRKDDSIFPVWQTINAIGPNDNPAYYISVFSDISNVKKTEHQLWHLAHYDSLTGLANRKLLEERLAFEVSVVADRKQHSGALIFLDLDNFKTINDSLGHNTGDDLLSEIAGRLKSLFRKEDTVARLGGDEFIVLITNLPANHHEINSHITSIVKKTLSKLAEPVKIRSHELRISASIGITLFADKEVSPENLLKQADTAMYAAKRNGKRGYCFYHPKMQQEVDNRLELEKELHAALLNDQFYLLYQPQYDQQKRLIGYEALVRWQHPEKGTVTPAEFITISEENGLILQIGEVILKKACQQMRIWEGTGHAPPHLSINISPRQFKDEKFCEKIQAVINETQADPNSIVLEITETVIVQNVENSIAKMDALKKLGFKFSIDDFGTGYSSLSYLTKLPLDQLKIDRSFVSDMHTSPSHRAIIDTIIAMAKALELNLVAEGIETEAQFNQLRASGCDGFQGYLFCKPLSSAEISKLH